MQTMNDWQQRIARFGFGPVRMVSACPDMKRTLYDLYQSGMSVREAAARCGLPKSTAHNWIKQLETDAWPD